MNKGPIIALIASLIILVGLYFFLPITPGPMAGAVEHNHDHNVGLHSSNFDEAAFLADIEGALDTMVKVDIVRMRGMLRQAGGADDTAAVYQGLAEMYERLGLYAPAVLYSSRSVDFMQEASYAALVGDRALLLAKRNNPPLQGHLFELAKSNFDKARNWDTTNVDYEVKWAQAYLDESRDVMTGVQALLNVVNEHPDNIRANLLLGKFGIISGQYEKALQRLEKVLSLQAQNTEALFLSAEALNGLGNKEEAIRRFNQCKALIDNPDFHNEIDQYIARIKNG